MRLFALIAFACLVFTGVAQAAPQTLTYCASDETYRQACGQGETRTTGRQRVSKSYAEGDVTIIGGRPSGCPHRYCGCGLARYLGLNDARLNLAWNWARLFPKAHAGPGMAVVWRHHVALIESMTGDGEALLRDYNSGKGLSRIHVRSIRGAVVVNPRSRLASND